MKNTNIVLLLFFFMFMAKISFAEYFYQDSAKELYKWHNVSAENPAVIGNDLSMVWMPQDDGYVEGQLGIIINKNFSMSSSDLSTKTLFAANANRFFRSFTSTSISLKNIYFLLGSAGEKSEDGGGAIAIYGGDLNLHADNVVFDINTSSNSANGGSVYVSSGSFVVSGGSVSFTRNTTGGSGGAIYAANMLLKSETVNFSKNISVNAGGAIYAEQIFTSSYTDISMISNTSQTKSGGAVYAGSGIFFNGGVCDISSNVAQEKGGAIFSSAAVSFLDVSRIVLDSNAVKAPSFSEGEYYGGAIYAETEIEFIGGNVAITNNSTKDAGGALFSRSYIIFDSSQSSISVEIAQNTISGDKEGIIAGGGALWAESGVFFFCDTNSTIKIHSNSTLGGNGGAICTNETYFDSFVTVSNNETKLGGNGGAIYTEIIEIEDGAYFNSNVAHSSGGAVFIKGNWYEVDDTWYNNVSYMKAKTKDIIFENNLAACGNDIFIDGNIVDPINDSCTTLYLSAASSRTISFGGGIVSVGTETFVPDNIADPNLAHLGGVLQAIVSASDTYKPPQGNYIVFSGADESSTLFLGGNSSIQIFVGANGHIKFGSESTFKSESYFLVDSSLVDMRNGNSSNVLYLDSVYATGATFYYDINLDDDNSDTNSDKIISSNGVYSQGENKIKIGLIGTRQGENTFELIETGEQSTGTSFLIDKTNCEGKDMTRVKYTNVYTNVQTGWQKLFLDIHVDQLNAVENLTSNEKQIAFALDKIYGFSTQHLFDCIDKIDSVKNDVEKKSVLSSLTGSIYANAITAVATNGAKNNIFARLKKENFSTQVSEYKRNTWFEGFSAFNSYKDSDAFSPGKFSATSYGCIGGFDTLKDDTQVFGIAMGRTYTKNSQNNDVVTVSGYNIGGYAGFLGKHFAAKFTAFGAKQDYSGERNLVFFNDTLNASFTGYTINAAFEFSYENKASKKIKYRPFVGADYVFTYINPFMEHGQNAIGLNVFENSYKCFIANAGFQVSTNVSKLDFYASALIEMVFNNHYYGAFDGEVYYNDIRLGRINIRGREIDRYSVAISAGSNLKLSKDFNAYIDVNTVSSLNQNSIYASVGVNFKFNTVIADFFEQNEEDYDY
ncbi:MAG: autotransporter domain-containing protein [Elusimicrobiota bacterium]|jgi:predicted outer membrane repeat protein|nr:autotransporter domain-containing protein [Elusimicrobiota bacterium]